MHAVAVSLYFIDSSSFLVELEFTTYAKLQVNLVSNGGHVIVLISKGHLYSGILLHFSQLHS